MDAEELVRRYGAGQRNFCRVNLKGANLSEAVRWTGSPYGVLVPIPRMRRVGRVSLHRTPYPLPPTPFETTD